MVSSFLSVGRRSAAYSTPVRKEAALDWPPVPTAPVKLTGPPVSRPTEPIIYKETIVTTVQQEIHVNLVTEENSALNTPASTPSKQDSDAAALHAGVTDQLLGGGGEYYLAMAMSCLAVWPSQVRHGFAGTIHLPSTPVSTPSKAPPPPSWHAPTFYPHLSRWDSSSDRTSRAVCAFSSASLEAGPGDATVAAAGLVPNAAGGDADVTVPGIVASGGKYLATLLR